MSPTQLYNLSSQVQLHANVPIAECVYVYRSCVSAAYVQCKSSARRPIDANNPIAVDVMVTRVQSIVALVAVSVSVVDADVDDVSVSAAGTRKRMPCWSALSAQLQSVQMS